MINATGFGRCAISRQYGNRVGCYFQAVKTIALVECESNVIIDIHYSMKQPRDSQIGWQVLARNLENLITITADKGYDWDSIRREL